MVSVPSYGNEDESHNERAPHSSSMAVINKTNYERWWAVGSTEKVGRQNSGQLYKDPKTESNIELPRAGLLQRDAFQGLTKFSVDSTSRSLRP